MLVEREVLSPYVSCTVTAQMMTSFLVASVLSSVMVLPVPRGVPVEVFSHEYEVDTVCPSASFAETVHVRVLSLYAVLGEILIAEISGAVFSTVTDVLEDALAPKLSVTEAVHSTISSGWTLLGSKVRLDPVPKGVEPLLQL